MTLAAIESLQQQLDQIAAQPGPPACFIAHVVAPRRDLAWTASAGTAGHGDAQGVLRIASITKSFVAAAVLRLVEQGRLSLDDALPAFLRPRSLALLRDGSYGCESITLRMLLDHNVTVATAVSDTARKDDLGSLTRALIARAAAEPA